MQRCTDCGCTNFREVESYLTCTQCGLVAAEGVTFLPDYVHSFADYEPAFTVKPPPTSSTYLNGDILDTWAAPLNLTNDMVTVIKGILEECKGLYKGDNRRFAFVAAAVHCAVPARSLPQIAETTGVPMGLIHKAMTCIYEQSEAARKFVSTTVISTHNATVHRLVQKLFFLPVDQEVKVKCTVMKLYNRVSTMDVIKPFKTDKLITALIFMACEKLEVKDGNINNVATACGAATSTLRNIVYSIRRALA